MDRIIRLLVFGLLSLSAAVSVSGDSFRGIGYISKHPFSDWSEAVDVSADGTVVIGQSATSDPNKDEAFRWTSESGMQGIGYITSGDERESRALAVSADGSVIVGYGNNANEYWHAFRWTSDGGMQELGDLEGGYNRSRARGISADGSVIVGESSAFFGDLGFTWTSSGGMARIMNLPGGYDNSSVRGISSDGTVLVGQALSQFGYEAFRLAGDEIQGLGDLAGGKYESIALRVSADGSTAVGYGNIATSLGREAFRWTQAQGMVGLGFLGGGDARRSEARDVTADGRTVVGYSSIDPFGQEAFIWDEVNGMRSLKEELIFVYGLDLTGWGLMEASGISDDGRVIVGTGSGPNGPEAWVAEITPKGTTAPPVTTWIFSGPIRQNDINLPGSPYPDIVLDDTMYGSFSIGENGSDGQFVPPGSYRFSGVGIAGSIAWENAVTSTRPTLSPVMVSYVQERTEREPVAIQQAERPPFCVRVVAGRRGDQQRRGEGEHCIPGAFLGTA